MNLGDVDIGYAITGAAAAFGAFVGQQVTNRRLRRVVTSVVAASLKPVYARLRALEQAQGWKVRKESTDDEEA